MADKRLSIFIDGGYLFKVFEVYYKNERYRYSCKRLEKKLSQNYASVKVHYFNSINQKDKEIQEKQERFFNGVLRDKFGWDVEILPLQWPDGKNAEQKGVDTALAVKLLDLAFEDKYDVAIIIAADSDFVPAVEKVKHKGKVVINGYFSKRPSWHLQQACTGGLIRLDEIDFIYEPDDPKTLFSLDKPNC